MRFSCNMRSVEHRCEVAPTIYSSKPSHPRAPEVRLSDKVNLILEERRVAIRPPIGDCVVLSHWVCCRPMIESSRTIRDTNVVNTPSEHIDEGGPSCFVS